MINGVGGWPADELDDGFEDAASRCARESSNASDERFADGLPAFPGGAFEIKREKLFE